MLCVCVFFTLTDHHIDLLSRYGYVLSIKNSEEINLAEDNYNAMLSSLLANHENDSKYYYVQDKKKYGICIGLL